MYPHGVPEPEVSRVMLPPKAPWEDAPLPPPVSGGSRHSLVRGSIMPISASLPHGLPSPLGLCLLIFCLSGQFSLDLGPIQITQDDLMLNYICKYPFAK